MVDVKKNLRSLLREPQSTQEILEKIKPLISYDRGLNRLIEYQYPGEPKQTVDRVLMNTRVALIDEFFIDLEERKKKIAKPKAAFLMLDMADAHFTDKLSSSAGDLAINRFAQAVKGAIDKFIVNKTGILQNIGIKIGRWGGDEFVVTIDGDFKDDLIEQVKTAIESKFGENGPKAYYKKGFSNDAKVVLESIKLKEKDNGSKIDVIKRPEDGEDQRIFDAMLRRGQILNPKQLESTKKHVGVEKATEIRKIKYIEGVATPSDKINYLIRRFPNLGNDLRPLLSEVVNDQQRNEVLTLLENRLFDPIFGTIVSSSTEFNEKFSTYGATYCLDLKFVKEMNEIVSYPEADDIIHEVYDSIREALGQDFDKVEIGRRGGTFFIGIPKTHLLSRYTIADALKGVQSLLLNVRNYSSNFIIGRSENAISLETLSTQASTDFYKKLCHYLAEPVEGQKTRLESIFDKFKYNFKITNQYSVLDQLIHEFFISKRAMIRSNEILKFITTESEFSDANFNKLRIFMNKLFDYCRGEYDQGKSINLDALSEVADGVFS